MERVREIVETVESICDDIAATARFGPDPDSDEGSVGFDDFALLTRSLEKLASMVRLLDSACENRLDGTVDRAQRLEGRAQDLAAEVCRSVPGGC